MKIQLNREQEFSKETKRVLIILENGCEIRLSECHLTGGLIINKFYDDRSICIIPRVSNEILLK